MKKKNLQGFISYPRRETKLVNRLLSDLSMHAAGDKTYELQAWIDSQLVSGTDWRKAISKELQACHFGLFCLSPAFRASTVIGELEVPAFMHEGRVIKPVVPVALVKMNLEADLWGLENLQIFLYRDGNGRSRFYNELNAREKNDFTMQLWEEIAGKFKGMRAGG